MTRYKNRLVNILDYRVVIKSGTKKEKKTKN